MYPPPFLILTSVIYDRFGVSGGCMNPTLSFGPAVLAGNFANYWVYWVGPVAGAAVAGLVFR